MKFPGQFVYQGFRGLLRNPKYRWWIVLGSLVYLVSPIDIAPDLIPILGQVDDVVLISILLMEFSQWLVEKLSLQAGNPTSTTGNYDASPNSSTTADYTETIDVEAQSVE
ncbi:MAG: YkvA family protein [Thainema sp.]